MLSAKRLRLVVLAIGLLSAGIGYNTYVSHRGKGSRDEVVPDAVRPNPSVSSPTVSRSGALEHRNDWDTYTNHEYNFAFQYPQAFRPTSRITEGVLPVYAPRLVVNLVVPRIIGRSDTWPGEAMIAPIAIAVHDKPSGTPIDRWLSRGLGVDVTTIDRGDLDVALTRASSGGEGYFTYRAAKEGGADVFEVGWARGKFYYAVFLAVSDRPFVYELSFELESYGRGKAAEPTDREFADLFNQIRTTFRLLD